MDEMFTVDTDVEMPLARHGIDWPFPLMEVGHSFIIPKHLNVGTVRQAGRRFGVDNQVIVEDQNGSKVKKPRLFVIQSMGDHFRCWRKQ